MKPPQPYICLTDICFNQSDAYETLIRRFEHRVFNLVSRLLDDPSDGFTVTQKVFRKIFRSLSTFSCEYTLRISIYRIAVSEARNHRSWFRRRRRQDVSRPSIEEALRTVNPTLRAALVLRETESLSCEEISEILDVSVDTVKSRIVQGRHALLKHCQSNDWGQAFGYSEESIREPSSCLQ
jgi:RNA polymerase sigma-70 factor (ECF subfamily)